MEKNLFIITISLLLIVQIACGQKQSTENVPNPQIQISSEKAEYPNLKIQAEEVGEATINQNFEKLVDFTYPKVVEKFGGKDKMIAFLKTDSAQMKAGGFEIEAIVIGEVKQIAKVENQIFAVVPMTMKVKAPNGKALGESSMVGISNDNGASWKFINAINQDKFKGLFPKASEKIQIPDEQAPKPIEN